MEEVGALAKNLVKGERERARERLGLEFVPADGIILWSTTTLSWRDWLRMLFGRPLRIHTIVWCERAPLRHVVEATTHVAPVWERLPPVKVAEAR